MWPGQIHGVVCVHGGEQLHDGFDILCLDRILTDIHDDTGVLCKVYHTQASTLYWQYFIAGESISSSAGIRSNILFL